MKRIAVIILFLFCLGGDNPIICFAQAPSASQIERTQENLEKERALRETIEREEKVFVKKVIVKGITLLTEEQIKEIILPFQKHWLSKNDIEEITSLIKKVYKEKGYNNQPADTSYRIKGNLLEIRITEKD